MPGKTTTNSGGGNGFFATVGSGIAEGLGKVSSEILPVWAADQLDVQMQDQLKEPTFNAGQAPPRQRAGPAATTGGQTVTGRFAREANAQDAVLDFNFGGGSGLLIVAAIAVGLLLGSR